MKHSSLEKKFPPGYLPGFDYLRVLFIFCVVAWHIGVGINQAMRTPSDFLDIQYFWNYIFAFNILLLAVPGFLLISNYLFLYKGGDSKRLKAHIKKLIRMLIFWTIITKLLNGNIESLSAFIPRNPIEAYALFSGNLFSVYFFLPSLVFTLLITYAIQHLRFIHNLIGLCLTLVCTFFIAYYAKQTGNSAFVAYYNVCNFISIPFFALLLTHIKPTDKKTIILTSTVLLFIGIITALAEWIVLPGSIFFEQGRFGIPDYARPSLFLLSAFLVVSSLLIKKQTPTIMTMISRYSLAIYLTHILFIPISLTFAGKLFSGGSDQIIKISATIFSMTCAVFATRIFTHFIRKDLLLRE